MPPTLAKIYRGNQLPERNLGLFATYIFFFPKLLSGPIEPSINFFKQKQINIMNAEFLKLQMKPKKKTQEEKMNDEEYRLNRDILEEIAGKTDAPQMEKNTKTKFLF